MFSLIITLVSIALVAALAVATLYYGGSALKTGNARAAAAAISAQSQQILGAVQVFRSTQGRWPDSLDELVDAKLMHSLPVPPTADATEFALISSAYAATARWGTVQAGAPYYWLRSSVPTEICKALNKAVRGDDGVYNAALPAQSVQCFGQQSSYTVLIGFPPGTEQPTMGDVVSAVGDPTLLVDPTGGGWALSPSTPVAAVPPGEDEAGILQVVAGMGFTYIQKSTGSWWVAGNNWSGQLGFPSSPNITSFTEVPALNGATRILTGNDHAIARLADGSWAGAGYNGDGELGLGHADDPVGFVNIPALGGATELVGGDDSAFAKLADGNWYATGYNSAGQLGLGHSVDQLSFVPVPGLVGATRVVSDGGQTFAQFAGGLWYATGNNYYGQLGLGNTTNQYTFTPVPDLAGAREVVPGRQTFAQLADGTWVTAGYNGHGELGLGHTTHQSSFVAVPGLVGATKVISVTFNAYAKLVDGNWAGTGYNGEGQLGLGHTTHQYSFQTIPGLAGATSFSAGNHFAMAKLPDGSWVTTGTNGSGQLGMPDLPGSLTFIPFTPWP